MEVELGTVVSLNYDIETNASDNSKVILKKDTRVIVIQLRPKILLATLDEPSIMLSTPNSDTLAVNFSPAKNLFTTPYIKDWTICEVTTDEFLYQQKPLDVFCDGKLIAVVKVINGSKINISYDFKDAKAQKQYQEIAENLATTIINVATHQHNVSTFINEDITRLVNAVVAQYLLARFNKGAMSLKDYFINMDAFYRKTTPILKS